ncbi:MAG: HDIG domain-containing protein [Methanosarcinales archaeon]|nr:MAG: HDIG domain-containing protein [Methanosarcinales archaeon]
MTLVPQSREQALFFLEQVGTPGDVINHCKTVAGVAENIARQISFTVPVNIELVIIASLVHDIGRSKSHGIGHAVTGAKIGRELGFTEDVVNIIKRHIGAGIDKTEAIKLELPPEDYTPKTIEEKIVAHADNLVKGTQVQTIKQCIKNLKQRSVDQQVIERIIYLHNELSALSMKPL